jgi:5'-nucleotidase
LLSLNGSSPDDQLVEVVLLSRNDPDTGLRVFKSIQAHDLNITRGAFLSGGAPYRYVKAFNASLFLSASEADVREAIEKGNAPAGVVLASKFVEDPQDQEELRIAFDFDGVLADDEAEAIFHAGGLPPFEKAELEKALIAHNPGPLAELLIKIAKLREHERQRVAKDGSHEQKLRIAIITARGAPAHERVITTLREWGTLADETFFLGGIDKKRILEVFRPHIFFDDQRVHLDPVSGFVPSVHVPFGVKNPRLDYSHTGKTDSSSTDDTLPSSR